MRVGGVHAVGVVLVDDPVTGGDEQRVGVGLAQEGREVGDAAAGARNRRFPYPGVDFDVDGTGRVGGAYRCRG